ISKDLIADNCIHRPLQMSVIITLGLTSSVYIIVLVTSLLYHFRWPLRLKLYRMSNWWHMRRTATQRPIDNADYIYDVFVIYNKDDSHWTRKVLVPQLEKYTTPKFCLCFYERNWLPGRDIVDCISESIRISRKTLLVITNSFTKCQWCYLEMTMAQHNVMNTDRDNVLLAVMEDIEEINLNPRLTLLMKSKPYLEWTNDNNGQLLFWEQM
ncbi:hypothetical protein CAPTEDRAFT_66125, partial [Capitella teleta]